VRIAHVVTYVSSDGAFGGPVAVALAQTEELARRGHEVELLAGWDGRATLPAGRVTRRLFPVHRVGPGFVGLAAPGLWAYLRRNRHRYDAVHVHLGRDLITLVAANLVLSGGNVLAVQTHGMVMPRSGALARTVDAVATRRALGSAAAVLVLTETERLGLATLLGGRGARIRAIANGVPAPAEQPRIERSAPPVVMFLARLHPRKRVLAFAAAARLLVDMGSPARFEIFGPDEGDLPALRAYLDEHRLTDRVKYLGPIPQGGACDQLRRAAVYVLPSFGEVFPMTILESLSVGTPVVLTTDCGISAELAGRGGAIVTDGSPERLAAAIDRLLRDGELRADQIVAGNACVADWLSIEAVGAVLEEIYR
jgi:glycosyltransferase involved in cell wall biosynthesis